MAFSNIQVQSIAVTPESEGIIRELQNRMAKTVQWYKTLAETVEEIPPNDLPQRYMIYNELIRVQGRIRTLDRLTKEEITRGSAAPVSSKNVGIGKKVSEATPEESLEQQHPTNHVKKEEFVEYFGLISREALELRKQQQQSGKVQRRRRTATKNTRYTSNGFLKLEEICPRRSRRLGASGSTANVDSLATIPIIQSVPPQTPNNSCFVCYGKDFDLSCETCTTKFHAACIKVTGSNAPKPHRLPICPKCVQAANTSQIVRIQNRSTKATPSIMHSPVKKKRERDRTVKKVEMAMLIEKTMLAMKNAATAVMCSRSSDNDEEVEFCLTDPTMEATPAEGVVVENSKEKVFGPHSSKVKLDKVIPMLSPSSINIEVKVEVDDAISVNNHLPDRHS